MLLIPGLYFISFQFRADAAPRSKQRGRQIGDKRGLINELNHFYNILDGTKSDQQGTEKYYYTIYQKAYVRSVTKTPSPVLFCKLLWYPLPPLFECTTFWMVPTRSTYMFFL